MVRDGCEKYAADACGVLKVLAMSGRSKLPKHVREVEQVAVQ